jgi:hypothetical protein
MTSIIETLGVNVKLMHWDMAEKLPLYLMEQYGFEKALLDGDPCLIAEIRGEMPTIQAVKRNIERIQEFERIPVVLKLNGLSGERRKALMSARIPFVSNEQVYLPFLGVSLSKKLLEEPAAREKLMPSAQLLFFAYLYQSGGKFYTNGMAKKMGFSAMQITRASRQLQRLNLLEISKDGVQVMLSGKAECRDLFEKASPFLSDPVREIVYVPRGMEAERLPCAGISALSRFSRLTDDIVPTYAYFSRKEKLEGAKALIDRKRQVRVEIWRYAPETLSDTVGIADPLSVVVSLRNEGDERIGSAIDEVLERLWG